jgi:hypothetical protein
MKIRAFPAVASDATRKRKLGEDFFNPSFVLALVRVNLRIERTTLNQFWLFPNAMRAAVIRGRCHDGCILTKLVETGERIRREVCSEMQRIAI